MEVSKSSSTHSATWDGGVLAVWCESRSCAVAVRHLIVIEKTKSGFSAYSPDLAGCVAAARTRPSVEREMREAIQFHLEGFRAEGRRVPAPKSYSAYVEVPA